MKLNLKNIIYAVAGGMLGIALFVSLSQKVDGLDIDFNLSNVLSARGGSLNLEHFQLARKNYDRDDQQANPIDYQKSVLNIDNENAIFRMVGTSIFDNFLSFGQTRFGKLAIGYPGQTVGNATLSVDGKITIRSLAYQGAGSDVHSVPQVRACVDDFGVIKACEATAEEK